MIKLNRKLLIIGLIVLLGFVLLLYFQRNYQPPAKIADQVAENGSPKIVSTKPDPLDEAVISATQEVEISFNRSLQNSAELKLRMEPEMDYKVELSGDRKTAKIIPLKPYPLGTTFTLFIGPETKFDGIGRWGQEKVFHFKTIKYSGV